MSLIKSIKFIGTNTQIVIQLMQELFKHSGALKITIEPWSDKRTIPANAQIHVWYKQIADKDGENVKTVELQCKRMFGLPILLESVEYGNKISWTLNKLDFFNWPYEQQCGYMELLPVTRLFTTKQHNHYRETMQSHYNKNGYALDYTT